MNSKKLLIFLVGILALGLSVVTDAISAQEGAYRWKSCHPMAVNSTGDLTQKKFAELVKQKSNGQIVIDCYAAEQLGSYRDMFDNVVKGVQEVGLLPISPEFSPALQIVYTVYIADTWEEGKKIYSPDGWMFKYLQPLFVKLGVRPLGFYFVGMNGYGSTKGPVVTPEDVKKLGIKTRVWCPADRLLFQEAGLPTVDIAFSELFTSLQTGVCHAQDNSPEVTYLQLRDVQKYYTDLNHIFEPLALLVNGKLFDGLSPDLKKALDESAVAALAWGNKAAQDSEEGFFKKMQDYKITVTRLTPQQKGVWRQYGLQSWSEFEKVVGKEAMDVIRTHIKK